MTVGGQLTKAVVDANLTQYALELRNICQNIKNLNTQINNQANGLAVMTALGYSTAANPSNPGGVSDAQYALNLLADLNTFPGVYYGQVRQGGDGSANSAILFVFDNALSPLWQGQ